MVVTLPLVEDRDPEPAVIIPRESPGVNALAPGDQAAKTEGLDGDQAAAAEEEEEETEDNPLVPQACHLALCISPFLCWMLS